MLTSGVKLAVVLAQAIHALGQLVLQHRAHVSGDAHKFVRRTMKRIPSALKHAAYSATAVLPGESQAEFEKLHESLIAELSPSGALEDDIVMDIARRLWRKQNLVTLRIAECARSHRDRRLSSPDKIKHLSNIFGSPADLEKRLQEAKEERGNAIRELREELGDNYELLELKEIASFDGLRYELDVKDRLDGSIDRCLKRLLFLRGLKSISAPPSSERPTRIPGPSRPA